MTIITYVHGRSRFEKGSRLVSREVSRGMCSSQLRIFPFAAVLLWLGLTIYGDEHGDDVLEPGACTGPAGCIV